MSWCNHENPRAYHTSEDSTLCQALNEHITDLQFGYMILSLAFQEPHQETQMLPSGDIKFQESEDNAIQTWKNVGNWNIVKRKGLLDDQLKLRTKPSKVGVLHRDGDLYASIHGF